MRKELKVVRPVTYLESNLGPKGPNSLLEMKVTGEEFFDIVHPIATKMKAYDEIVIPHWNELRAKDQSYYVEIADTITLYFEKEYGFPLPNKGKEEDPPLVM